ncbi:Ref family recombination enhancement nuclease [Paraburkholderia phenoliruptrix]|uniref:Ref family recombination enhancement nuclease n=1 Tax=Paraburkholderia phenoliruptrix TaxID=252970 RepID=UPI0028644CDD|nr:Ref family recombination enhancement nuclease [Paraburkholderia phenoliruptrix]MDR6393037.1 hypothetical protein [Paraburkholderia phenoliruptrix]
MNKAESAYLGKVARLGCVACNLLGFDVEDVQPEIHHPRTDEGMGERASHWLAIGLCPTHHRGPNGVHGDKGILRQLKCSELDLLAWVISRTQS